MTELVCIVCPQGCRLQVDEDNNYKVTGNKCSRGEIYGKKELTNPTRVVTSTVVVENSAHRRCPIKTNIDIPKGDVFKAMDIINKIKVKPPIKVGDVLVENLLGTGANIVATKNILD